MRLAKPLSFADERRFKALDAASVAVPIPAPPAAVEPPRAPPPAERPRRPYSPLAGGWRDPDWDIEEDA